MKYLNNNRLSQHFSTKLLLVLPILILGLGVLVSVTPKQALAAIPPDNCFAFNSGTGTITDYYDNEGNNAANPACSRAVDIPSTIGEVAVASIGDYAFSNNQLTSITIPNSVTSIDYGAFEANQLTNIVIQGDPTDISDGVFYENSVPIQSISYNGTNYEASSTRQLIPEECLTVEDGSIYEYKYGDLATIKNQGVACLATNIEIPSAANGQTVTRVSGQLQEGGIISNTAGFKNTNLTAVVLPASVTEIGNKTFQHNNITSLSIKGNIESIGLNAFSYNRLTQVNIPTSLNFIGPEAFSNQTIRPLALPVDFSEFVNSESIESIEEYLDSLTYVRLNTSNNTNPEDLKHDTSFYCAEEDMDTWECLNYYNIGGYLINPAQLTLNYLDQDNQALLGSRIYTGASNEGPLFDYKVSSVTVPEAQSFWHSPEESVAIDAALNDAYFTVGETTNVITPPAIPGFVTPEAKTFTLSDPETVGSFTYQPVVGTDPTGPANPKPLTKVDFSKPSGSTSNPTADSVPSSLSPAMANSTFTVDTNQACATIDAAKLLPASNFTAPDSTYTTLGGLDFTLSCTEPGKDAKVSLSLASEVSDPTTVKIYKKTADGKVTDITNQTTITNQAGKTTISYSLTDGGALDDDGTVNGAITDPIYVTVPLEGNQALLADTGASLWLYGGAAAVLILAAIGLVVANRRILSRR